MPRRYRIVDVFAERKYTGNPLTVVLDAQDLTAEEMQAIAKETNHSETTFVLADRAVDGAWPVRIFTPAVELPFAGHPTLGTAAVIQSAYGVKAPLVLDLAAGRIPVTAEGDVLWMRQNAPEFHEALSVEPLAACLGLSAGDLDAGFPAQAVSTGVPFTVVPLRTLDAARRASLDLRAFRAAFPKCPGDSVLVFAPETESRDAQLHVRCFTEAVGIPEDPATGSACGTLAAWLSRHRYLGSERVDIIVEQGIEVGRPSRLHLRAAIGDGGRIEVRVGGRVVPVAEGHLL